MNLLITERLSPLFSFWWDLWWYTWPLPLHGLLVCVCVCAWESLWVLSVHIYSTHKGEGIHVPIQKLQFKSVYRWVIWFKFKRLFRVTNVKVICFFPPNINLCKYVFKRIRKNFREVIRLIKVVNVYSCKWSSTTAHQYHIQFNNKLVLQSNWKLLSKHGLWALSHHKKTDTNS